MEETLGRSAVEARHEAWPTNAAAVPARWVVDHSALVTQVAVAVLTLALRLCETERSWFGFPNG